MPWTWLSSNKTLFKKQSAARFVSLRTPDTGYECPCKLFCLSARKQPFPLHSVSLLKLLNDKCKMLQISLHVKCEHMFSKLIVITSTSCRISVISASYLSSWWHPRSYQLVLFTRVSVACTQYRETSSLRWFIVFILHKGMQTGIPALRCEREGILKP